MKEAAAAGYKIYLYMVATESPEINKFRVKYRVTQNGHSVPEDRIESRYFRSLELMYEAAQHCYQAYFFDNSENGKPFKLAAHFKKKNNKKVWDPLDLEAVPERFKKYN